MTKEFNFDIIVSREGTDTIKYDFRKEYFGSEDVIPMWVADMDFSTPKCITDAIQQRAQHPIYGYTKVTEDYLESIVNWQKTRHQWEIEKDWVAFSPGIVPAVNFAIQAYTQEGDGIIVQPPVYFPFFSAVKDNNRTLLENQLKYENGSYSIDFDDLEKKAKKAKMLILSSPHNPVGRCFTKDELEKMGEICLKNNVIILSDEIHNDLILPGYEHITTARVSKEISDITITCIAPTKTFNIAGLSSSSVIIPNEKLRKTFTDYMNKLHITRGNLFGYVAATAGYQKGAPWVDALMEYIEGNFELVENFITNEIPQLSLVKPEATYLAWIDFAETGLSNKEIKHKLIHEAGVGLSHGPTFGQGGSSFQRMNLATNKKTILDALEKISSAFKL
ncbi:MAG: PatB family C-S lyase [Bacteroidales bacterium]|nr:PatB family C-S lyase [Bacteroidales bacterium]